LKEQRYRRVLNDLAKIGVAATVWRAVDGTQPIEFEPGESVARFKLRYYAFEGKGLYRSELACYLSHYRLLKHALESGYERVVVLEDDVVFDAARFKEALQNIAKLDQAFEYIHFNGKSYGGFELNSPGVPIAQGGEYELNRQSYWGLNGNYGYAVSRRGLKKLLPALMPIRTQADKVVIYNYRKTNLQVWAAFHRRYALAAAGQPGGGAQADYPRLCYIDPTVASSIGAGYSRSERARLRYQRLAKFALAPLRWIYVVLTVTDWTISQQGALAARGRFAYARTLARVVLKATRGKLGR